MEAEKKPHVVCIPLPVQGHINPMMQVAKLLHSRGFFITFVNTSFSHKHLMRSESLDSLECLESFAFETISDGLPPSFEEVMDDPEMFCYTIKENCVAPFRELLKKLHHSSHGHGVTCIVSDAFMTFTVKVAEELGIPEVLFCPMAACAFMSLAHYGELIRRGLVPVKDESCLNNVHLDNTINWIPGMREMQPGDLPNFILTTKNDEFMPNFAIDEAETAFKASKIFFNTFEDLEHEVLQAMRSTFPPRIYTIGPLSLQCRLIPESILRSVKSSMWKEETECLKWLDSHKAASVIYVNFGSTTVLRPHQLMEFAWGIKNSNYAFLWVIRPNLIMGGHTNLPQDFMNEIEGRGVIVSWCPQEEVLAHPSVAAFLTHCGWNSTSESISFGVPMLCWPFFGDQQTNCCYTCKEWGMGMEIENNANREVISALIKELMEGEKGKEVKEKALKWKKSAEVATKEGGSSQNNLKLLIDEILHQREN